MIVNCDHHTCVSNIAGECVNVALRLKDGECQSMEEGESTGEIIEMPTAYKNVPTETAYRTEEDKRVLGIEAQVKR